ncbi:MULTISPECIES: hypothetical protein [unclassified Oceanobacillus]|uniref:hypothetical protein n=1 Tax=Oceanobacillus TaxID=182709 RepID=UPI001BEBC2F9|nr:MULTISPECIES: hypothetical protein [unclassified Oceanobacillus]MBT2601422.1 hypothetical protein [Oceanobacillus sp. ISL-74]MBT2653301.1 hypothetical protein [Oceanobacillus sp. ISL-73]
MANYSSNRKQIVNQMRKSNEVMMDAVGRAAVGMIKAVTPVGQYPTGSGRVGGSLRGSIDHMTDEKGNVFVGSTLMSEMYPIYVHEGTSRQSANPYIRNGVMNNMAQLRKIAEGAYKL